MYNNKCNFIEQRMVYRYTERRYIAIQYAESASVPRILQWRGFTGGDPGIFQEGTEPRGLGKGSRAKPKPKQCVKL